MPRGTIFSHTSMEDATPVAMARAAIIRDRQDQGTLMLAWAMIREHTR